MEVFMTLSVHWASIYSCSVACECGWYAFFVLYVNRSKWVSFVCQAMLKRKMSFNFPAQHAIQAIFWRWKHEDTCASSFSFPQLKLFYQSQEFLCVELHTTKGKKTQLHNCLFCFVFFRLNKVFMITRFQIGYFFLFEIVDCTQVSMKLNLELSKLMIFLNALVRVVLMGACKTPLSQNARILHHFGIPQMSHNRSHSTHSLTNQ